MTISIEHPSIGMAAEPRRLRVCHIMSADLWAGAEVQLATVASYLAERPDVDLFVVLFNDGALARELRALAIDVTVVDEQRTSAAGIVAFLAGFLRARGIDIVHTHRHKDNLLGTAAAKLARVPHVVRTVHGLGEPMRGWDRVKYQLLDRVDRIALSYFSDAIIAVSRHTAETLRASGYRRSIVRHIHNGVNLQKVRPSHGRAQLRRALGVGPDALLIGTAGRLSPVKAQDDLIRAAKLLDAQVPGVRVLMAGDGPLRGQLEALAAQLGISRQVLFAGARDDIYDLIAAMDIFVLPSLSEGVPMALLEAMALGTPVVATAVGGVPEMVTNRATGLLVPPRDERALADACLELALNRPRALRLADRARRSVEEEFSRDANGRAVVDAYHSIAGRPNAATGHGVPRPLGLARLSAALVRGFMSYARRRCRHALDIGIERRRMQRLRHNPDRLTSALRSARGILIVCQGNIIRSPFAARLVAQALSDHGRVAVKSAGLGAVPGRPPHPTAAQIATTRSVDLTGHAASPLAPDIVSSSDVIFVMDVPQLIAVRERFPEAWDRTFLLTCLAADAPLEIGDPVDGDESRFQSCFDHISRAVRPIVHTLAGGATIQ
jgi:glycosyltransferase involved in cell wall biosynthesis/protein-tyrosine-phosphatase